MYQVRIFFKLCHLDFVAQPEKSPGTRRWLRAALKLHRGSKKLCPMKKHSAQDEKFPGKIEGGEANRRSKHPDTSCISHKTYNVYLSYTFYVVNMYHILSLKIH